MENIDKFVSVALISMLVYGHTVLATILYELGGWPYVLTYVTILLLAVGITLWFGWKLLFENDNDDFL